MTKPAFVLVHGAWHTPSHWEPLATVLISHGYRVVTPALPSCLDPDEPNVTIPTSQEPDIAAVRTAIIAQLDSGFNVVVVAHSYGGLPAGSACKGLARNARTEAGYQTSVIAFAAIATSVLPKGMGPVQELENVGQVVEIVGDLMHIRPEPGPYHWFYDDMSKQDAEKWITMCKPACSVTAAMQPSQYTAYEDIPVHYLLCEKDKISSPAAQQAVIDRIHTGPNAGLVVEVIDAAHSPHLSKVEETATFLRRAAGETVPA